MNASNLWRGNARRLERIGIGISGKFFPVIPILPPETEIGYTSSQRTIHLVAYPHPIIKDLDEIHQIIFTSGVYAHELMHQLETDFKEHEDVRKTVKVPELFDRIFNVIEDPAIEYWAPHYFGGPLLKSLRYSIMHIYETSTKDFALAEFGDEKKPLGPLTQFINAVIQYGDGGLLKGKFESKEAEDAFRTALPIIDKAITEPSGKKRIALSLEVYHIVESFVDAEAYQQEKEMINNLLKQHGKSIQQMPADGSMTSLGDTEKSPIKGDMANESKKRKREATARQYSKTAEKDDDNKPSENGDNGQTGKNDPSASTSPEDDDSESDLPDLESDKYGGEPADDCSGPGIDPTGESVIDYDTYEFTAEDIEDLTENINEILQSESQDVKKAAIYSAEKFPDFAYINAEYPGVRVLNRNMACSDSANLIEKYAQRIIPMSAGINQLANQLKRVIHNDREDRDYRCSGRLNVNRYSGSRITARIFDKHIEPRNVSDIAVMILIDCSGSMLNNSKCEKAKLTAIGLAEALSKVNIPFKVIGFRADIGGYHVVHEHFVNFHNTVLERAKLLHLHANGNNFDGYSIRYGSELLSKRPEQHKLMFVISDGQPAAFFYNKSRPGVSDTMRAVRYAQKKVHVIGLAIDANIDVLHTIYRDNFLVVNQVNSLLNVIGQKIKKEMVK